MVDSPANLQCYLVGGAVRDEILGLPVKDRDWVVVGSDAQQMSDRGFRPVGRDFPVFLHPHTGEQYALARTERKSGRGYRGFTVWADPSVTLEQDLERRDLTINAIARTGDGRFIDPFGGRRDIDRRILRHVSPAFREDPLRVLRTARFMARFAHLGFRIAPETRELMREIAADDELEELAAERVWQELAAALGENRPDAFVETLRDCGALVHVLPEVDALFGVPQTAQYHPEVDTGSHVLMVLRVAAELSQRIEVRFSALVHDLGKATTPSREWPRHVGHESRGVPIVEELCDRLRVPNRCRRIAVLVCRHHLLMHRLDSLRPITVLRLLLALDAARRPQQVEWFAAACEADSRGRGGRERAPYPQRETLLRCRDALLAVDLSDIGACGLAAEGIPREVERRRLAAVRGVLASDSRDGIG